VRRAYIKKTFFLRVKKTNSSIELIIFTLADSISEEERIVNFLLQCYNPDGGFGAAVGHDSHMLYTLSAVQVTRSFM
jgi:prenyltransferase beta subunit